MRDIRPQPKRPEEDELGSKEVPKLPPGRPLKQAWMAGSNVPVAHVNTEDDNTKRDEEAVKPIKPVRQGGGKGFSIGYKERVIVVVIICLAVMSGILASVIFLPSAKIKLILRTAPLLVDERVTLQTNSENENTLPGTAFFREVSVEGQSPVENKEIIGEKATGNVDLVNKTTEEQKIKDQSRLLTKDGQLLYMQRSVTLPAGPSRVSVPVIADQAGEAGNLTPQRLDFAGLSDSSRQLIYGEVTSALAGGSGEEVLVVKEDDIERARTQAGKEAKDQVEEDIRGELPDGWLLVDESWNNELVSFETKVNVDDREPTIPYSARIVVRVFGFENEALTNHLKSALEQRMDKDYMLFPGPITYTKKVESVNWEEATAELNVRVTHTTIPQISLDTLKEKIMGRSEVQAKQYLSGLPGVRSVTLDLWPFWVQSIPRIERRISMDLESERQP